MNGEQTGQERHPTTLAIVVAVIGLLLIIAIAIPSFFKPRFKSAQQACIDNLRIIDAGKEQAAMAYSLSERPKTLDELLAKKISQSVRQYYQEHKHYPDSLKDVIRLNGADIFTQAELALFSYTNEGNRCVVSFATVEGSIRRITLVAGK
jgi:hypothetical protein